MTWVAVDFALPVPGKTVLVWMKPGGVFLATLSLDRGPWDDEDPRPVFLGPDCWVCPGVTHWSMPPDPPE